MLVPICQICDEPFKDGEPVVIVGLTTYHQINSTVHYAVEHPRKCLELLHVKCHGGPLGADGEPLGMEA